MFQEAWLLTNIYLPTLKQAYACAEYLQSKNELAKLNSHCINIETYYSKVFRLDV